MKASSAATLGRTLRTVFASDLVEIGVRIDTEDAAGKAQDFQISLSQWFFHPGAPDIDLAAVPISTELLKTLKLETGFFASDVHPPAKRPLNACAAVTSKRVRKSSKAQLPNLDWRKIAAWNLFANVSNIEQLCRVSHI